MANAEGRRRHWGITKLVLQDISVKSGEKMGLDKLTIVDEEKDGKVDIEFF